MSRLLCVKGGRKQATGALHSRIVEKSKAIAKKAKAIRFVMLGYDGREIQAMQASETWHILFRFQCI